MFLILHHLTEPVVLVGHRLTEPVIGHHCEAQSSPVHSSMSSPDGACSTSWAPIDGACSWAPLDGACSWACFWNATPLLCVSDASPYNVSSPPDSLRSSVQSSTLLCVVASRLTAKLSPVQYTPLCRRLQTHCEAQSSPVHSSMSSPPDSLRSSVQSSTLLYVVASRLTAKLSPVQYTPLCRRLQTHCEAQSSPVHSSMSSPPDSLRSSVQSSTLLYVVASRLTVKLSPVQYTPLCRRPVQYTPLCRRLQTHCEAQSSPVHSSMSSTHLFFHRSSLDIFYPVGFTACQVVEIYHLMSIHLDIGQSLNGE